jgi:hypothetical protein
MKMLPTPEGRGRGSGAEATADTVAMLLVSVLATDNLSETELFVYATANAAFLDVKNEQKTSRCPFTSSDRFVGALARLLEDEKLAKFRPSVVVSRDGGGERIIWHRSKRTEVSHFGSLRVAASNAIERHVSLSFPALLTIKNELGAVLSSAPIRATK